MKRTKVLHVLSELAWGGVPMRTLELTRYVDSERYDLCFCTTVGAVDDFENQIEMAGGRVVTIPYDLVRFGRRFTSFLCQERFDAVHSHLYYQSGNILRLAARCRVPIRVAHFRSSSERPRTSWRRKCEGAILRHWIRRYATDILAVSEEAMTKAWHQNWRSDPRCRVVYNGLDLRPFENPPDRDGVRKELDVPNDAFVCIHVGRMATPKNHRRLVEIFAALLRQRQDAYLLLIGFGDKSIETDVRQRVDELGINQRVRFCGMRKDVPRLLMAADVMVFPSLWEGLPGVVLEACAAGVPVVASNLQTVREIASRLPGIEIVSLEDSNEAWASRIAWPIGGCDANRNSQTRTSRLRDSGFSIETHAEVMCSIWDGQQFAMPVGG